MEKPKENQQYSTISLHCLNYTHIGMVQNYRVLQKNPIILYHCYVLGITLDDNDKGNKLGRDSSKFPDCQKEFK